MTFSIRDIQRGEPDSNDDLVLTIYTKIGNAYAVYRTEDRVRVQFSDDPILGGDQRKLLAPLGPLVGEINGLIDGWRKAAKAPRTIWGSLRKALEHDRLAKAALFDRRVADALTLALQGAAAEAGVLLSAVKSDVVEERNSVARTEYLLVAGGLFLFLIAMIALATASAEPDVVAAASKDRVIGANAGGFAASMGALGALFSIALALRSRELLTDLQSLDNIADAAMRIVIGAISAFILYCLISAGYFTFGFGGGATTSDQIGAWQPGLAVIGFVAGFSERLVGNVLSRATLVTGPGTAANPVAGGTAAAAVGGQSHLANERNPLGRAAAAGGVGAGVGAAGANPALAAVNDDEESDGGEQHDDLADDVLTVDVELPEATGGVERQS